MAHFQNNVTNARFGIDCSKEFRNTINKSLRFIWNDGNSTVHIEIDRQPMQLKPEQILCTTHVNHIDSIQNVESLKTLWFNREFYCVHTYDSEVSCNGLLFYGSAVTPVIQLDSEESLRLRSLFNVLEEEFSIHDENQEEMLRILLKRFIIRCTRLARRQFLQEQPSTSDVDLIRQFNYLLEEHFRTLKTVGDYAALLYRSPKTITNIFSKYANESALRVIHNRIVMEARRMLLYTDAQAKEIADALGYEDQAQFSKLFKKHTGMSPTTFRNNNAKRHIGQY
jgi:AraC-like DNA-binding protein